MRIDRMLSIVITLLYKEKVSARELAQKFEVSIRTVYRDIEAINRAGIPVVPYSGSNGGYGLMNNFKLDRRLLSMEDFIYIISSLKGINETLDNKEIENAIDKISSLIPKEKSELFDSQLEHIIFDMVPWGYAKRQSEKVKILHQSIINKQIIKFQYTDQNGKPSKRNVEPLSLVYKGSTWYLFGYCKTRNDYRTFRLSRINDLIISQDRFVRREMSYKEYSQKHTEKGKLVKFVLKFHPGVRQIVEDYFDEKNITICKDNSIVVSAMYPEGEWFLNWLLSYGDKVEIIEPAYLKKALLDITKKIFNLYNADIMVSK